MNVPFQDAHILSRGAAIVLHLSLARMQLDGPLHTERSPGTVLSIRDGQSGFCKVNAVLHSQPQMGTPLATGVVSQQSRHPQRPSQQDVAGGSQKWTLTDLRLR